MPAAKTIQIFLPSGDPRGVRIAEITTRIVQLIEVPRSLLSDFLKMPESNQVALYFLVSGTDESETQDSPTVYVGQTGDLRARLASHNKKKDFWQRALVVISRTNSLTQTHALFLEWYCLQAVGKAGRYRAENGNEGTRPHTPAPLEADCLEIFETASTLLATLGHPLFDALSAQPAGAAKAEVLHLNIKKSKGLGLYTPEGFVVLKGSVGVRANVPSFKPSNIEFRKHLVDTGVMKPVGDTVVFQKDHLFASPSMAALAVLGRTSNGWIEWRDGNGATLDKLKRSEGDDE